MNYCKLIIVSTILFTAHLSMSMQDRSLDERVAILERVVKSQNKMIMQLLDHQRKETNSKLQRLEQAGNALKESLNREIDATNEEILEELNKTDKGKEN